MTEYVCTLEPRWIEKAKTELFEVPEDRLSAVQALNDWLKAQPHITWGKLDTVTMLNFLRWAKFSQVKAREKIEAYLSIRDVAPGISCNIDTGHRLIEEVINTGYLTLLPERDDNGCQIILIRFEAYNLYKKFSQEDFFRVLTVMMMYALRDETTQVNGMVLIFDWTNVSMTSLVAASDKQAKAMKKAFLTNMPIRFKCGHHFNGGVLFDTFMLICKVILPKKLYSRMKHHDNLETVYDYVPRRCFPVEYLPDDYNGSNAGTMDQLRRDFLANIKKKEFTDYVKHVTSNEFSINQSKKPTEQVTQHFRKLNVD